MQKPIVYYITIRNTRLSSKALIHIYKYYRSHAIYLIFRPLRYVIRMKNYRDLKVADIPNRNCVKDAVKASRDAGFMDREIDIEETAGETVIRAKRHNAKMPLEKARRCPKTLPSP